MNDPRSAGQRHRSLESRLEIERVTSGLEGGCWKSVLLSNSLAAYPTRTHCNNVSLLTRPLKRSAQLSGMFSSLKGVQDEIFRIALYGEYRK